MTTNIKEIYAAAQAERDLHTNAVLNCQSAKMVVVAGPGTGKTHLFQKLLEKRGKKSLVLSFVNALVDDLALGLSGMSEVRTLHGYVASYLWNARKATICPFLPEVITEDAKCLLDRELDFDKVFKSPSGQEELIQFYKGRKEYYGKYYGYTDATYAVVKDLEAKKKSGKLPKYDQVLVDEYQDFSELEIALIDLLAEASPVLIAGDDGQTLYTKLKGADPNHLRALHGTGRPEYIPFNLPFCSRCPEVVVEAVNDVTEEAKKIGLLANNIEKPYRYFKCEDKDKISAANPQILYFQRMSNGVVSLLIDQLDEIATREQKEFSVLVIVPPKLKKLIEIAAKSFRRAGFRRISYPPFGQKKDAGPTFLDGLKLLLADKDSVLGWRVVARHLLPADAFAELIAKSSAPSAPPIFDLIETGLRAEIRSMRATLNYISEGKDVETERLANFLSRVGYDPIPMASQSLKHHLDSEAAARQSSIRNVRDLPITISTIPGSKGLAADYVFLIYFDQASLGGTNPTDEDVFNFVVAMTRAKKALSIVSTKREIPRFVQWIKTKRLKQDLMPDYGAQ